MMKTVWVAVISIGLSLAVNAGEVSESASSTEGVGDAADQQLATAEGEDKKIAVNTKDKLKCEPTRITGSNLRKKVCLTEEQRAQMQDSSRELLRQSNAKSASLPRKQ